MHVVATAGHVDHGKSTLVRTLTGYDPDRLAEEKRRGLTIELGYCWTRLGGEDVAFVDVPGHERFIGTTLTGLGPVPAVMFVVAADDPWMPQAAEHLAALDALRVRRGVLVVSRSDLADPARAVDLARAALRSTSLADLPSVAVSAVTGEGIDELKTILARTVLSMESPDPAAPVRLWLDRRFHVRGIGTVVTGTLQAGTISIGDRLSWSGAEVRVRGLQSLERPVDSVSGTARVAVALRGDVPADGGRGGVLVTPGAFPEVTVVDVAAHGELPERPVLHVGATSTSVHLRPLADGFVRLTLDRPLPLDLDDRVLLRDPGTRRVAGADVLALDPPPLRRRGAARSRAAELRGGPAAAVPAQPPAPAAPPLPAELPGRLTDALGALHERLGPDPFDAPGAEELDRLGLDAGDLVDLARAGRVLRLDAKVVLLPGADERAAKLLATLEQPFTTSSARTALGTSRRVVLPLLAHLDRTGRTVRLADDTRRMRSG